MRWGMHISAHACTNTKTRVHMCTYTKLHVYTRAHKHTCTLTCKHTRAHTHTNRTRMCACIRARQPACICVRQPACFEASAHGHVPTLTEGYGCCLGHMMALSSWLRMATGQYTSPDLEADALFHTGSHVPPADCDLRMLQENSANVCALVHGFIHVRAHVCVCVCVRACLRVCVCMCVRTAIPRRAHIRAELRLQGLPSEGQSASPPLPLPLPLHTQFSMYVT